MVGNGQSRGTQVLVFPVVLWSVIVPPTREGKTVWVLMRNASYVPYLDQPRVPISFRSLLALFPTISLLPSLFLCILRDIPSYSFTPGKQNAPRFLTKTSSEYLLVCHINTSSFHIKWSGILRSWLEFRLRDGKSSLDFLCSYSVFL